MSLIKSVSIRDLSGYILSCVRVTGSGGYGVGTTAIMVRGGK